MVNNLYMIGKMRNFYLIKILLFFVISLVTAHTKIYGQCQDTLQVCKFGKNNIDIELTSGFVTFAIHQTNGMLLQSVEVLVQDSTFSLEIESNISGYQKFSIFKDSSIVCEGIIFIRSCVDIINYSYDYNCILNSKQTCSGSFFANKNLQIGYCLGDTSTFKISEFQNGNIPYLPLTPERLETNLGEVLFYSDFEFKIVWSYIGEECLTLTTSDSLGNVYISNLDIKVFDNKQKDIKNIGFLENENGICVNDTLFLTIDLEPGESLTWYLNNQIIWYGDTLQYVITEPGEYKIFARKFNECSCAPPAEYPVTVFLSDGIDIKCVNTICLGDQGTYFASVQCNEYIWNISNGGTIVGGGGIYDDFVRVLWHNGFENTVSLQTPGCFENTCSEKITKGINIINPQISIEGKLTVCNGDQNIYQAPYYSGTNYNWTVPNQGVIMTGQGSNIIRVRWLSDTIVYAKIKVDYKNCNIDCDGYAEIDVLIKPKYTITHEGQQLCTENEFVLGNTLFEKLDWKVLSLNDSLIYQFNDVPNIRFALSKTGKYKVVTMNQYPTTCNIEEKLTITVLQVIPTPNRISGPTFVCIGKLMQYTLPGLKSNEIVEWNVFDGDLSASSYSFISPNLSYSWTSTGPYKIEAKIKNTFTGCESNIGIFNFSNTNQIVGPDSICINTTHYYYLQNTTSDNASWSIVPASAGRIISSTVNGCYVEWRRSGSYSIRTSQCGIQLSMVVRVGAKPKINYNYDQMVCKGKLSTLRVTKLSSETCRIYNVKTAKSTFIDNSIDLLPGRYYIYLRNGFGCTVSEVFNITEHPEVSVQITAYSPLVFCGDNSLLELETNLIGGYSYQWFRDNIPILGDSMIIKVGLSGAYYLIATDNNGCTHKSNVLSAYMCCDSNSIVNDKYFDLNQNSVNCWTKTFNIQPTTQSNIVNYNFGDGATLLNISIDQPVTHTYKKAGVYRVSAVGNAFCDTINLQVCGEEVEITLCESDVETVRVPVIADFSRDKGCVDKSLYFNNLSTNIGGLQDVKYLWDFGDPSSGTSNTSILRDPYHTFRQEGIYFVTLTISESSGCSHSVTKEVVIENKPTIEIIVDDYHCEGYIVNFISESNKTNLSYIWNFGDISSPTTNSAYTKNPNHIYPSSGTYNVLLTVFNSFGCDNSTSKTINIENHQLTGSIISSIPMPKCESDSVVLSAPMGNYTYRWNTGQTTRSIKVTKAGKYSVVIKNHANCTFNIDPFEVYNFSIFNTQIWARKYLTPNTFTNHFDSINICHGERFNLISAEIPGAEYFWSNGYTTSHILDFETHFSNLKPGRYEYFLTLTMPGVSCINQVKPFVVIVRESPPRPVILSQNGKNCQNEQVILFIDSLHSNVIYGWNDGSTKDTIYQPFSIKYSVTATNLFGCKAVSEIYEIFEAPKSNEWLSGCMETCLPRDFCINFNKLNQYELFRNDVSNGLLDPNTNILSLQEGGEYFVKIVDGNGCKTESEILAITPEPIVRTVSGRVYYDENNNNTFDGDDQYLNNIIVELYLGDSLLYQKITDSLGYYYFDSLTSSNVKVVINHFSADYHLKGSVDSTVVYQTCRQDKTADFPLINSCKYDKTNILEKVCRGDIITIDGKDYKAYDKDTISYKLSLNCDSLVYIDIDEYVVPEVDLHTFSSCYGTANGSLLIKDLIGADLLFRTDSSAIFLQDSLIHNLASGDHLLQVYYEKGCVEDVPFSISEFPIPEVNLFTLNTCNNLNQGILFIDSTNTSDLKFSLQNMTGFETQLRFDSLQQGNYILHFSDENGCFYKKDFTIFPFPKTPMQLLSDASCQSVNSGLIAIINSNPTFQYGIDQFDFLSSETTYDSLAYGQHILYVKNEHGCLDTTHFFVDTISKPLIEVSTINTCQDLSSGSVQIENLSTSPLKFSISGKDDYSDIPLFDSLQYGQYTLVVTDTFGCDYLHDFFIDTFSFPQLTIQKTMPCFNQNNGFINIISDDNTLLFSINNMMGFSHSNTFDNLQKGLHTIFAMNQYGCIDSISFEMLEKDNPEILLDIFANCEENKLGSVHLLTSDTSLVFSLNDSTYQSTNSFENLVSGSYILYLKTNDLCIYQKNFEIPLKLKPSFLTKVVPTCLGDSTGKIIVQNYNPDLLFSLDNIHFTTLNTLENLHKGLHTLYVRNSENCMYDFSIHVLETIEPFITMTTTNSCQGTKDGTLSIRDQINFFEYSLNSMEFTNDTLFEDLSSGMHTITIKDSLDCLYKQDIRIGEHPKLDVVFPELDLDCFPNKILVSPKVKTHHGTLSYLWNNGDSQDSLIISQSGWYGVTVSDECEAKSKDWNIDVHIFDENSILHSPNIFSPNVRNENSCFKVIPIHDLQTLKFLMRIYDRWGNLVFLTTDINECWDGKFENQNAVEGVYVFVVEMTLLVCDGAKTFQKIGDVTLIY